MARHHSTRSDPGNDLRHLTLGEVISEATKGVQKTKSAEKNQKKLETDNSQQVNMGQTIDEPATQRLLQAIAGQQQVSQQAVSDLQQLEADIIVDLANRMSNPKSAGSRLLHLRVLSQVSSQIDEDPVDFLTRFEVVANVHSWTDVDKLKHFQLALQKNPLKWLQQIRNNTDWSQIREDFSKLLAKPGLS